MDSTSSPAPATPPATEDDSFPMKKWQFKLRKPSLAIHLARRWRVVQSAEPQQRMRDRDPAMVSSAHQLHAHEPSHDAASRCTGSLNKAMCTQDVEQTVQGCDWISTLPDDILIKVLSLLTVSDAAMTSCLSTRWRHLWKNVDNLILSAHNLRMQELELSNCNENPHLWKAEATKFVQKVNGLLHNHYGTRIKEFTVRFPLTSANASELDDWIQLAASASTEKLCLDLDDKHRLICRGGWKFASEPYEFLLLPLSNGRGCQLRELTLSNCRLGTTPENLSGFSCLHYLSLGCVSVTDAAVSNIMSSCRALKTLILQYCWELVHLTITHSQLLKLAVVHCSSLISVCIHADDLRSFEYMGHEVDIEYEYGPFLDILRVYFVEKNECPLDFISALPNLPKLETLVLLFSMPVPVPLALRNTFRFANLKATMLMLVTSWKGCICSLAYLLEGTPLLECFWLHGCAQLEEPCKLNMTWPEDLTFARLDTILIKGFSGESELMELLYFLLRRAPVLKTLQLEARVVEPCFARMEEHKLKGVPRTHLDET